MRGARADGQKWHSLWLKEKRNCRGHPRQGPVAWLGSVSRQRGEEVGDADV